MPWQPGTLLGLCDPTQPFGRFPGDTLFLTLGIDRWTGGVIVLTPDGHKATIPACYLVRMDGQGQAQELSGATQAGQGGVG